MADRERDLLFGALAVQLSRAPRARLAEAADAWLKDPACDLSHHLVQSGCLTDADRNIVDQAVEETIQACGGNPAAALESLGGEEAIQRSFQGSQVLTEMDENRKKGPQSLPTLDNREIPAVEETPGRYEEVREHGRGGVGRVLLVHDEHLGRDIALKELLPEPIDSESDTLKSPSSPSIPLIARFLQEARITSQLDHPGIVPVYELGRRQDGTLYYTMKLVRGKTLNRAIKDAGSLEKRLELLPHFVDLCQAIAYAHSRGVIHRDIKPSNVMVGEFGETVVLDWGLAKVRDQEDIHENSMEKTVHALQLGEDGEAAKTAYGQVLGTPVYMAPEQAQGEIDKVNERTDVYALGAALYILLTGEPPFKGKSAQAVIQKVIHEEPEPIRSLEPKVPAELAAICAKAMAKDPAIRYLTAKELADEIQRYQSDGLVGAYEYKFSEHLWRFVNKRKAILVTASLALIILLGVGVFSFLQVVEEKKVAEEALGRAVEARKKADLEQYYKTISLAASRLKLGEAQEIPALLESCPPEYRDWEWGYLMAQCQVEEKSLQAHEGSIRAFEVSADGQWAATAGEDRQLVLWDTETLEEKWRYPEKIGVKALAFHPEGQFLAAGLNTGHLMMVQVETGERISNSLVSDPVSALRFSTDGESVYGASSIGRTLVWQTEDLLSGSEILPGAPETLYFDFEDEEFTRTHLSRGLDTLKWNRIDRRGVDSMKEGNHLLRVDAPAMSNAGFRTVEIFDPSCPITVSVDGRGSQDKIDMVLGLAQPPHSVAAGIMNARPQQRQVFELGGIRNTGLWFYYYVPLPENFDPSAFHHISLTVDKDGGIEAVFDESTVLIHEPEPDTSLPFGESPTIVSFGCEAHSGPFTQEFDNFSVTGVILGSGIKATKVVEVSKRETLGPLGEIRALAVSPDGNFLATGGAGGQIAVHNQNTWETVAEFMWQTATLSTLTVNSMAFDSSSTRLVCTASGYLPGTLLPTLGERSNGMVTLWDIHKKINEPVFELALQPAATTSVAIHPEDSYFLTGSDDGTAKAIRIEDGQETGTLHNGAAVKGIRYLSGGKSLLVAGGDGTLKLWSHEKIVEPAESIDLAMGDLNQVRRVAFSSDGSLLVAAGSREQGHIGIWDAHTLEPLRQIKVGNSPSLARFHPVTNEIVVSFPNQVRFYDVETMNVTRDLPMEGNSLSAEFDASGKLLLAGHDNGMELYDVENNSKLSIEFEGQLEKMRTIAAISADGRLVAAGDQQNPIAYVWEIPSGNLLHTLRLDEEGETMNAANAGIFTIAFHPTGDILATGRADSRIVLWDVKSGNLLGILSGHTQPVHSVEFSPNGKRLLSSGDDRSVRLWDWQNGQEVLYWTNINFIAKDATFSPDGLMIASTDNVPALHVRKAVPWNESE